MYICRFYICKQSITEHQLINNMYLKCLLIILVTEILFLIQIFQITEIKIYLKIT